MHDAEADQQTDLSLTLIRGHNRGLRVHASHCIRLVSPDTASIWPQCLARHLSNRAAACLPVLSVGMLRLYD